MSERERRKWLKSNMTDEQIGIMSLWFFFTAILCYWFLPYLPIPIENLFSDIATILMEARAIFIVSLGIISTVMFMATGIPLIYWKFIGENKDAR